jgi:hypothetical protein
MIGTYASRRFELKGKIGGEPWRMGVTAKAFGTELRLNGTLKCFDSTEGLALSVHAEGRSFKGIATVFGLAPLQELGPFKIACDVSGLKDKACRVAGLKFVTRAGSGNGELLIRLNGPAPQLQGRLHWRKLDLSSILSGKAAGEAAAVEKKKTLFSSEPFRLPMLTKMQGEMEITADEVVLPHFALKGLKTELHSSDNRFAAKPLRFAAGGGETQGAIELIQEGGMLCVAIHGKVNEADLNLLLTGRKTQGKAEAEIDLACRGDSMAALMGSLTGRTIFSLRGFGVENKYIKLLDSSFVSKLLYVFTASRETPVTERTPTRW